MYPSRYYVPGTFSSSSSSSDREMLNQIFGRYYHPVQVIRQPTTIQQLPVQATHPVQIIEQTIPQPQSIISTVSAEPVATQARETWMGAPVAAPIVSTTQVVAPTVTETRVEAGPTETIIRTKEVPTEVQGETITVPIRGENVTGLWVSKPEEAAWIGEMPIQQYPINEDPNPDIIRKKSEQDLLYTQNVTVKYLKPPTPPPHGDIRIVEEKNISIPPAPPLVIRQQPCRPQTPPPTLIREAPPRIPPTLPPKIITIPGRRIPPPPRKVIIERLPQIPPKPPQILVDRWLPYGEQVRRVIFEKNTVPDVIYERPKNLIIQWESPNVLVQQEINHLGIVRADPNEYVAKYGETLKTCAELLDFVKNLKHPENITLACDLPPAVCRLEGDLDALSLIDLDKEGLSELKPYLQPVTSTLTTTLTTVPSSITSSQLAATRVEPLTTLTQSTSTSIESMLDQIMQIVEMQNRNKLSDTEAKVILALLNERLGRKYSEYQADRFLESVNPQKLEWIDLSLFRNAVLASKF